MSTTTPRTSMVPATEPIIYTTSDCRNCTRTKQFFASRGITYREIDASEGTEAHELLKAMGERQVPVVIAGDLRWSGLRPDMIVRFAAGLEMARREPGSSAIDGAARNVA